MGDQADHPRDPGQCHLAERENIRGLTKLTAIAPVGDNMPRYRCECGKEKLVNNARKPAEKQYFHPFLEECEAVAEEDRNEPPEKQSDL